MDIGLDRVHRAFHDQFHANRGGQVVHDVTAIDPFRQHRLVVHRIDHVMKFRMPLQRLNIVDPPRGEIVDDKHLVSPLQQLFRQMRPYEPCTTGDQRARIGIL